MGSTNSKTKSSNTVHSTYQLPVKNKDLIYSGWQEICQCSHSDWRHGISRRNFDESILDYFFV